MASLESILKLKDGFTNTINKITSSMESMANTGNSTSTSLNTSMDIMDKTFENTKININGVKIKMEDLNNSLNGMNITPLELYNEAYGNISEKIEYTSTKLEAQRNQHNSLLQKVKELQNEYQRLKSTGEIDIAKDVYMDLQKARKGMADMGLATHRTRESMMQLKSEAALIDQAIKLCEVEQAEFNETIKVGKNILNGFNIGFSKLGVGIGLVKDKASSAINYIKNKMTTLFSGGIGGYIKAFVGIAAVRKLLSNTIGTGAKLQQQMSSLIGMMGNENVGKSYFNELNKYASISSHKVEDLMRVTQQFLGFTRNTKHLMSLTKIAEKLAFRNPTQGIEGAGYAINEALSGQFQSLRNRFNLSSNQLEPIKKAIAQGNYEGIERAFNEVLASSGITDEVIQSFRESIPSQISGIGNEIKTKLAEAGMGALEYLNPILSSISDWLDDTSSSEFFSVISNGLALVIQGFNWLGETAYENWDIIQPVLLGLGILAATVGAMMFASWVMSMAPLIIIAGILGIAIIKIKEFGITTEEIIQFICGLFALLGSTVGNIFIFIWNTIVDVAEFLNNVFIDPVYAIKKLFYDLAISVLEFFNSMLQGIASGINWITGKINEITGTSIKEVEINFMNKWIANLEGKRNNLSSDKNVVDFSNLKLEYFDGSEAFEKGTEIGTKLFNTVNDSINDFSMDTSSWNNNQIGALNGIKGDTGKISDSIDISNEDLKYLRDIAEQEAINKFTKNTIVPQLEVNFGDVHESADVEKIIDIIAETVEEAYDINAEGVHA